MTAAGIYFKSRIDNRIDYLHEEAEAERKNTPPSVTARLGNDSSGQLLLEVVCLNDIPIEASWHVQTRGNTLVTGFQTSAVKMVPNESRKRFLSRISIQDERVVDNYLKLVFRYRSAYAPELNNPSHLDGKIMENYRYVNGRVYERKE
ncbi:MAG: hypothetical protein OXI90_14270 [Gammaproteobacteria bacterium]|nr:hypothetical protein [Gammaproteobacteria bacterium]